MQSHLPRRCCGNGGSMKKRRTVCPEREAPAGSRCRTDDGGCEKPCRGTP